MGFLGDFLESCISPQTQGVYLQKKLDRNNDLLERQLEILERKEAEEAREKRIAFFGEEAVLEMERRQKENGPTPEEIKKRHEKEYAMLPLISLGALIIYGLYLAMF